MDMLHHHIEVATDAEGHRSVTATFDLGPEQAGAAAHAVRVIRDVRYRTAEMSADDVLAMRDMTSLADELGDLQALDGRSHVTASVARLGVLRGVLEEFASAEHLEREGDAVARPFVVTLVDAVADLHAEAVHLALTGEPVLS
jgi:hypothetical protein